MKRFALPILIAALGSAIFVGAGLRMRDAVIQSWEEDAEETMGRITETTMFWVSVLERDLRAIATLYYASGSVSEDELLDAVDVLSTGSSAIPLISVAYAEAGDDGEYRVKTSTDLDGPLAPDSDLTSIPGASDALQTSVRQPERTHYSRPFQTEGEDVSVLLFVNVPAEGMQGVVITRLDLTSVLNGVYALLIPEGVDLRFLESYSDGDPIEVIAPRRDENVTKRIRTKVDNDRTVWWFEWLIDDRFMGGPATQLAAVVMVGGATLSCLVALVIAVLLIQNARVNQRVDERTVELEEARVSADHTRDLLTDAIESIDAAFVMYDRDEELVIVNGNYRKLFPGVSHAPGTKREIILRGIYRAAPPGEVETESEWIENRMADFRNHRTGELRKWGDRWVMIDHYGTTDGGTVALISDVTELQEARETAERAQQVAEMAARDAEAASRAKSAFLANVSHKLRTPLNAITGFSDILAGSLENPQDLEHVRSIQTSGKALLDIVTDILDLARIESGTIELHRAPVDTMKLFGDIEDTYKPRAADRGLSFAIDIDHRMPRAIRLDEKRFAQILSNVVDNAVKFTHKGGVSIKASCVHGQDNRITMKTQVTDTGIGIPADQIEAVFGSFTQKKDQSINEYGGMGIGLALTGRLVDLVGGSIDVESVEGEGSTFTITIHDIEILDTTTLGQLLNEARRDHDPTELESAEEETPIVDDDVRSRLPSLIPILSKHTDRARDLSATLTINDVEQFAAELTALGEEYGYAPLQSWAERLANQTATFDMAGMEQSLQFFDDLIAEANTHIAA